MKNSVDNATGKLSMQSFINGWVKSKINQAAVYQELQSFYEGFVTSNFPTKAEDMKKAVDWNAWINDPTQTGLP